MCSMDRHLTRKYSQSGSNSDVARGTKKQHSLRPAVARHGSTGSRVPGEHASSSSSSSSVIRESLHKNTNPSGGAGNGAASAMSGRRTSSRNRDVRFTLSDNRESVNTTTKQRTSHYRRSNVGGGTMKDIEAITGRIMREINDLLDVSHLETDQFTGEIMAYIGTINSREIQYKIRRVVENYRFLVKQLDQQLAAREQLLADLGDWFLQKDLPDFWLLVEPDTDDKKALFLRTVAEVKVNFDKFMRYRREIGMLAFRGENVDVLREQKKAIEENIMMLLHRIRDLQPAAIIRDTLDSVYFAESDLLSAHIDTTWKTTAENIYRLLRQLEPGNESLIRLIEESMNRLALDMVSLTVKMKELTGRLLEVKSVGEHWKDENFSLAADKAKLEERLRFLEAHLVEAVELREGVSPSVGSLHTAGSMEHLLLSMDKGRLGGRHNSLQTAQELEFLRSQAKLLKADNWELQKERDTRNHELELLQDKLERAEDKLSQVSIIVRQLEAALTMKSAVELRAMKKDRVELAMSPAMGSSGRWKHEEVEEVVKRYADHTVMPVCPRCQCVFEWTSNNDFIASLHELVLRQQKLLDRFTADVPPGASLHLDMSDDSLDRTMQLMRQHQIDTDTSSKPKTTENTGDDDVISSAVFGTKGKTKIVNIGTQTLHLHSDVTSLLRSFFTQPINPAAPHSHSPERSRTDVTQMGLVERRAKAEEERLSAKLKKRSSTTSLSSLLSIERAEKLIEEDAEGITFTASISSIPKSESSMPDTNTKPLPPVPNRRNEGRKEAVFLEVHSLPVPHISTAYHHQPVEHSRNSAMTALLTIYKIDPNEIRAGLKMFKEATDSDAEGALGHLRVFFDSTNSLVEKSIRFMSRRNREMRATLSEYQLHILVNRLNEKAKRLPGIKYLGLDLLQNKLLSIKQLQPVARNELLTVPAVSPMKAEADSNDTDMAVNVQRWSGDVGLLVKQAIDHCQQVTVLNQSVLVAHAEEYAMLNDIIRQSRHTHSLTPPIELPTPPRLSPGRQLSVKPQHRIGDVSPVSISPHLLPSNRVSPIVDEVKAAASSSQLQQLLMTEQKIPSGVWLSVSGIKINEVSGRMARVAGPSPAGLSSSGRRSSNNNFKSTHTSLLISPKLCITPSHYSKYAAATVSKTTPRPTQSLAIHSSRIRKKRTS